MFIIKIVIYAAAGTCISLTLYMYMYSVHQCSTVIKYAVCVFMVITHVQCQYNYKCMFADVHFLYFEIYCTSTVTLLRSFEL